MTILIILFGALTSLAGILIVINPETVFGILRKNLDKLELHILAVVVRLVLGALLIFQADASKYPVAIEVIGWLSVVAAISLSVIGRQRFRRLMSWALTLAKPLGRAGGVAAACFGVFLIYAFV